MLSMSLPPLDVALKFDLFLQSVLRIFKSRHMYPAWADGEYCCSLKLRWQKAALIYEIRKKPGYKRLTHPYYVWVYFNWVPSLWSCLRNRNKWQFISYLLCSKNYQKAIYLDKRKRGRRKDNVCGHGYFSVGSRQWRELLAQLGFVRWQ